jgi:hypothetical protein
MYGTHLCMKSDIYMLGSFVSNDRFYPLIHALLEQHGALGVNYLAKELNVPISTLQKYLDKDQNYFKKNQSRKWVLPGTAVSTDMSVVSNNFSNVIDSQLMSMEALITTLMSQFRATVTLIESNKGSHAPVANKSVNIRQRLIDLDEEANKVEAVIKKQKSNIPEEYINLLLNFDYVSFVLTVGHKYAVETLSTDIYGILSGKDTELNEETVDHIKDHQKS